MRLFDAWGDQMKCEQIGNIWNKLGQQLRDDGGREAWVVEHSEVLGRLRRRSVEVLPEWQTPEWLGNFSSDLLEEASKMWPAEGSRGHMHKTRSEHLLEDSRGRARRSLFSANLMQILKSE